MRTTKAGAALVVAALGTMACGSNVSSGPMVREHHTVERGTADHARIDIDMSAGDLAVKPGGTRLFEGYFDFNVAALKPAIVYEVGGAAGTLKVSQGSVSGNYENSWRLSFDEQTPLDLQVKLGAGDAKLELGRLNLRSLAIRLGAGDLVLDLRGMPARGYGVSVQAGAGDTTIDLPAGVRLSVRTSGVIGDTHVSGLEERDGRWVNTRANESTVGVDVDVQHAVGDLRISAE